MSAKYHYTYFIYNIKNRGDFLIYGGSAPTKVKVTKAALALGASLMSFTVADVKSISAHAVS